MKNYVAKNFKFGNKGLAKVLGSLEQEIIESLWRTGEATGKEVLADVRKKRKVAVTTVFTVLERLSNKGLVNKTMGETVYLYSAVYSREELARSVSTEVLKGVLDLWSGSAVASFVDILAQNDPEELDRLSRLIAHKKQELEKGPKR